MHHFRGISNETAGIWCTSSIIICEYSSISSGLFFSDCKVAISKFEFSFFLPFPSFPMVFISIWKYSQSRSTHWSSKLLLFTKINVLTFLFSIIAAAIAVLPNPGGAIKTE